MGARGDIIVWLSLISNTFDSVHHFYDISDFHGGSAEHEQTFRLDN